MICTLVLRFSFDAAHFLPHVDHGHKCRRMHGHTYRVVLRVHGPVDGAMGWVVDYAAVKALWGSEIMGRLDHRVLNEVPGLENSTAENVAAWIGDQLQGSIDRMVVTGDWPRGVAIESVLVWETERCGVEWRPQ